MEQKSIAGAYAPELKPSGKHAFCYLHFIHAVRNLMLFKLSLETK
jgi:hypothetical protein